MTIKVRVSGEPDEIARLLAHLRAHFEVAGGDHTYPNRGPVGVRAYAELREHNDDKPQRVAAERIHPNHKEIEP